MTTAAQLRTVSRQQSRRQTKPLDKHACWADTAAGSAGVQEVERVLSKYASARVPKPKCFHAVGNDGMGFADPDHWATLCDILALLRNLGVYD